MLASMRTRALPLLGVVFLLAPAARAADATIAGAITTPHPTLENLSVEWAITGDDDADGVVSVRVREAAGTYRQAAPLVRVPAGSNQGFSWANRHAGSVFGLTPDTEYELELTLVDPDGGGAVQTVKARTRSVPQSGNSIVKATPADVVAKAKAAKPGDVLLLAPGTYAAFTLTVDGSASAPITVRGEDAATVVIDGDVRLDGRSHVIVETLTVKGKIKLNDGLDITVRGCTITTDAEGNGIVAYGKGSTDGTFVDNVITGKTVWAEASLGVSGDNKGEGIQLTGAGNVIAYNRVRGFRDCLSLLEDDGAVSQVSVDIYGNELAVCADDGIEADFSMGNVRVYQNRITSSFIALSSQPSLGGPTYFVRNAVYGAMLTPFKLLRGSVGDVVLHNTVVKNGDGLGIYAGTVWSRAVFRNNLFLGGAGGGVFNTYDIGSGRVLQLADADPSCSFDYDGLGAVGIDTFSGRIGKTTFATFAELTSKTSEAHAVKLDLTALRPGVTFPSGPFPELPPADLRLAPGSVAMDKGLVLPGINDGFEGAGPDLGAYEGGAALPAYGPRTGGAGVGGSAGGGAGGKAGTGGTAAAAGTGGSGGAGTGGTNAGGGAVGGSSAGGTSVGGSNAGGAGGSSAGAGANAGGTSAGGTNGGSGTGGKGGAGGGGASPGAAGKAGTGGLGGKAGGAAATASGEDEGCGCRVAGGDGTDARLSFAALVVGLLAIGRRRSKRTDGLRVVFEERPEIGRQLRERLVAGRGRALRQTGEERARLRKREPRRSAPDQHRVERVRPRQHG